MSETECRAREARLIQQWKEMEEDLERDEGSAVSEDNLKHLKEKWFLQAFAFLQDLPPNSHCWCGHRDIMMPLLEPFFNFFQETSPKSALRILWTRLCSELKDCTRCVVQHHKAKEYYTSEFMEDVVEPLLHVIRTLDEERVVGQIRGLLIKFNSNTLDPGEDSVAVICVMFEVLMFPFLLDDAEINLVLKTFLLHVEETHDLSLAPGQRYPGVYNLLLHADQSVRRIALKLAHSRPTFKDEQDLESIQSLLQKCMRCLEYDTFESTAKGVGKGQPFLGVKETDIVGARPAMKHARARVGFTKEALWIGLTTILSLLEPPAFLKVVLERHTVFVNIVLNHVSEATVVFWNALRCLKLLLEVLGYKLWLGTTFSPGVMRNTLLGQCFHSHEERMHVHIFDLFLPFLQSLEPLLDGEYENQRRRLLYFLLQQVPCSSNFKPLMTKKARQVAFAIIGRGYTMNPPVPPVECVHVWGPPLVATIKDTVLVKSLRQSALDLMQSILVGDAAALSIASARQYGKISENSLFGTVEDDTDSMVEDDSGEGSPDKLQDVKYWISFLSMTKSVEESENWCCVPLLWEEILTRIDYPCLPLSFTKAMMWALSRVSLIDSKILPNFDGTHGASSSEVLPAFEWAKPTGYDDGAGGEGCVNAVQVDGHHKELLAILKRHADTFISRLRDGGVQQQGWSWEARMAEPLVLLLLDSNSTLKEWCKDIFRLLGVTSAVEGGLELLCSSEASTAAVSRGIQHAVNLILHWPLTVSSKAVQQLFFHIWKLLTLGEKESEKLTSLSQVSQDGGFLPEPQFSKPGSTSATNLTSIRKDEVSWSKLCRTVASQIWALMERILIEGIQHLEGAGQLMTLTRMLQLLPWVCRQLDASLMKQVLADPKRNAAGSSKQSSEVKWFQALVRWGDVHSPIIHRWWKEAVASIVDDLTKWKLVSSSQVNDILVSLRAPGAKLNERHMTQLENLFQSLSSASTGCVPLDNLSWRTSFRTASLQQGELVVSPEVRIHSPKDHQPSGLQHIRSENLVIILDSDDEEDQPRGREVAEPDDIEELDTSNNVEQEVGVVMLDGLEKGTSSPTAMFSELSVTTSISTSAEKQPDNDSTKMGVSPSQVPPQTTQFRRPSVRKPAGSKGNKMSTLDKFLTRDQSEQSARNSNTGGFQVPSRLHELRPPVPRTFIGKGSKHGRRLSELRAEHLEDLVQRANAEPVVRSQIRERVEMGNVAKQPLVEQLPSQDSEHLGASLKVPQSGAKFGQRKETATDQILRELVIDNEVDPLDAAFENIQKSRSLGLKDVSAKPKRQLISLEMPGEMGRGGSLQRVQVGLTVKPRQIPRLDDWYRQIFSLDYMSIIGIYDENTAPVTNLSQALEKVPTVFKSPEQYMGVFRPLLLEEFKAQLQRSYEELVLSDGMTTGVLRLMSMEKVDDFQLGRFMAEAGSDGAGRACAENDLLLLTRQPLKSGPQSCHLLAKVEKREHESKTRAVIILMKFYIQASDPRLAKAKRLLVDRSKWHVTRLMNMTPQLRECQALSALSSLPLLPILLDPGSSCPALVSSHSSLTSLSDPLQDKLKADYNDSQLSAISAAIGGKEMTINDHQLTLVQGPPGTGKTRTIVAILSALLALRVSKKKSVREDESNLGFSRSHSTSKSSNRDAAAMYRAWQDAALAKQLMKDSTHVIDGEGPRRRVLVCAQSNGAVDEIIARICKQGLYGPNGSFFRPSVVRVGAVNSVHPSSLPVYIDTLVEQRLGAEKQSDIDSGEEKVQSQLCASRIKMEEVIEFIQVLEALRSKSHSGDVSEKIVHKTQPVESDIVSRAAKILAEGESAVTAKLNILYRQRREISAQLAAAEKEGKRAFEESKNKRKALRKDIIKQADVVVTTLSGCGGDIYTVCMEALAGGKKGKPIQECFFDAVVIDEAAQALEPATLIPLQLLTQTNARCVMVGDPKQLPATVLSQIATRMAYECSMFERLQRAGYPSTMLTVQYRMHPEIRQFPSAHFYDNLITDGERLMVERKALFHREAFLGPYVFFNVKDGQESTKGGSSASQSLSNDAEVEVALQIFLRLKRRYPAELREGRVGVISPYKQQINLLRQRFTRQLGQSSVADVEFNTVDGFQGRELDIIILSTVRASSKVGNSMRTGNGIGFVADVRRMNVALTRARYSLWIIGSAETLQVNPSWAELLSNVKKRSLLISVKKPYATFFQQESVTSDQLSVMTLSNTNPAARSSIKLHDSENGSEIEVAHKKSERRTLPTGENIILNRDKRVVGSSPRRSESNNQHLNKIDRKDQRLMQNVQWQGEKFSKKSRDVKKLVGPVQKGDSSVWEAADYTKGRFPGNRRSEVQEPAERNIYSSSFVGNAEELQIGSRERSSSSHHHQQNQSSSNTNNDENFSKKGRDVRKLVDPVHEGDSTVQGRKDYSKGQFPGDRRFEVKQPAERNRYLSSFVGDAEELQVDSQDKSRLSTHCHQQSRGSSNTGNDRDGGTAGGGALGVASTRAKSREKRQPKKDSQETSNYQGKQHNSPKIRESSNVGKFAENIVNNHRQEVRESSRSALPIDIQQKSLQNPGLITASPGGAEVKLKATKELSEVVTASTAVPIIRHRESTSEGMQINPSERRRTSRDDLMAARKRQREEAAAALSSCSGLLPSSKRPSAGGVRNASFHVKPGLEQKDGCSTISKLKSPSVESNQLELVWDEFNKALEHSKLENLPFGTKPPK